MLLRDFSVRFRCPSAPSRTVLLITVIVTALCATASTFVGESIPVVHQGRLVGALSEGDIFNKVLQIQASLRQQ